MSIVNKNMTKGIFLENDTAAILNSVNKTFSPGEPLMLSLVLSSGGTTQPKTIKYICYITWFGPFPLDYQLLCSYQLSFDGRNYYLHVKKVLRNAILRGVMDWNASQNGRKLVSVQPMNGVEGFRLMNIHCRQVAA